MSDSIASNHVLDVLSANWAPLELESFLQMLNRQLESLNFKSSRSEEGTEVAIGLQSLRHVHTTLEQSDSSSTQGHQAES